MTNIPPQESEFASRIRGILDQGTTELDQRVSVRLYEARCDALRHHTAPATAISLAGTGQLLSGALHDHYRGILAFLALMIGALGVHLWQNAQEATDLAEIDSALLSDEIPPSAYTDPGFMVWLQRLSESEDETLSQ